MTHCWLWNSMRLPGEICYLSVWRWWWYWEAARWDVLPVSLTMLTIVMIWLLDNSQIANSRTGRLADWTSRVLDKSRTRGCRRRLCVLSFRSFRGICETASCPVRELTSPRDVQSASWRIRELSSYRWYWEAARWDVLPVCLTMTMIMMCCKCHQNEGDCWRGIFASATLLLGNSTVKLFVCAVMTLSLTQSCF